MKKLPILITLIFSAVIFSNCKKEKVQSKDYTASVNDKTWWGTFHNAGEAIQYYSVHFNADHSVVWNQISGDYPGNWTVEGNKVTLDFPTLNVKVEAEIGDNNKWQNISTNTPNKVNTGELIENPDIQLDNTIWNTTRTNVVTDATIGLKFTFIPGNIVLITGSGLVNAPFSYSRSLSGGAIRIFTITQYFGVITADGVIKGNFGDADYQWQGTRL